VPDVGDPFDVAEAMRQIVIPDAANAFSAYSEARGALSPWPTALYGVDYRTLTWSGASEPLRSYAEQNRPALLLWRDGSERASAIYTQPGLLALDTVLPVVQDLRTLSALAGLEGSRDQESGAMEDAWRWYRAMLRSSRHVGTHGVIVERLVGAAIHEAAARHIVAWAADQRTDAKLLRRALAETLAADALTSPVSENLKREYLMYLRDIGELRILVNGVPLLLPGRETGWLERMIEAAGAKPQVQRWRVRATNDVERSRRVLRLVFANWLAQVDKPPSKRAAIAVEKPTVIYAADPSAPAAARAMAPQDLDKAIDRTSLAREIFHRRDAEKTSIAETPWEGDGPLARELRRRGVLIVKLAAELYRREQGRPPATAGALLGNYLHELPEGIAAGDPIPDALP
jgi:hypothetical protein